MRVAVCAVIFGVVAVSLVACVSAVEESAIEKAYERALLAAATAKTANAAAQKDLYDTYEGLKAYWEAPVKAYISEKAPYWCRTLGMGGSWCNFENTIAWASTLGNHEMATGCVGLQAFTMTTLRKYEAEWKAAHGTDVFPWQLFNIQIGSGMEHHAVSVYPAKGRVEDGVVFDAWILHKPRVWTHKEWEDHYKHTLNLIAKSKDEQSVPCFEYNGKNYNMADGECERTTMVFTCSADTECRSRPSAPCTGQCVCGSAGINQCHCVKPVPADARCYNVGPL